MAREGGDVSDTAADGIEEEEGRGGGNADGGDG